MTKKKLLKSKPCPLKKLKEGEVYVLKRHGFANLYRVNQGKLEFLIPGDKNNYEWCATVVGNDAKFIPISIEDMMRIILETKILDRYGE